MKQSRQRRKASWAGVALAVMILAGGVSLPAEASASQWETGWVVAPTGPYRAAGVLVGECRGLANATAAWATGRDLPLASTFWVDPATYGQRFELRPDAPADLVIVFQIKWWNRVVFDRLGVRGETGFVPDNAVRAFVCMAAGPPTTFTYRAG